MNAVAAKRGERTRVGTKRTDEEPARSAAGGPGPRPGRRRTASPPPQSPSGFFGADTPAALPAPPASEPDGRSEYSPQQQASIIRNALFASQMATSIDLNNLFSSAGYKLYLQGLLEESGSPTDPIEKLLIEQISFAHFRIGQLHGQAALARDSDPARVYNAAAIRLLGELRKTVAALQSYRDANAARRASSARSSGAAGAADTPRREVDTELGSKPGDADARD